ncbi:MAG TPA: chromosome partitioning protein, partial [Alcanivorax sp.]|nr:chromosome partitioning protein [Alcanivorax sp.]
GAVSYLVLAGEILRREQAMQNAKASPQTPQSQA